MGMRAEASQNGARFCAGLPRFFKVSRHAGVDTIISI
jgi:hypothetical protein